MILQKVDSTRCRYPNYRYDGQLLLVMEYYSKYVTPTCPSRDNCTCLLTSVQEKIVLAKERIYSVKVACANNGLTHFPKLPKHTRTVDLSGNLVSMKIFSQ